MCPEGWGLPIERIERLPEELRGHGEYFRDYFCSYTRDTSEQGFDYIRGILTLERDRHFAGISRSVQGEDGQALQHFMSESPWRGRAVFAMIEEDICRTPEWSEGISLA